MSPEPHAPDADWQRLDVRMLLIHPVKELMKFLPVLLGIVVAGTASGGGPWVLLGVAVPIALGVIRYLTTTYRFGEDRIELRRGLLHRHNLATPVDRVRTVDLTASPIHRILGLATVVVGTGSAATGADERIELDALPRAEATALRVRLLEGRAAPTAIGPDQGDEVAGTPHPPIPNRTAWPTPPPPPAPEVVVIRFTPRWLLYAPFTGTVLVVAGAVLGVAGQLFSSLDIEVTERDLAVVGLGFLIVFALVALLVLLALSVVGYLLSNGNFLLSRHGATWHVRRGLLTQRETSIDVDRLAGVSIGEPAALRVARGRRVTAIVTGLGHNQAGSSILLPPAPADDAHAVATAVLGSATPVDGVLQRHGRAAHKRRLVRALLGVSPIVVAVLILVAVDVLPSWALAAAVVAIPVGLALGADRAAGLGHGFLDGHVVMRSGSMLRSRDALRADHVIGWNLRATWFQRRADLVSVSATTAGGSGSIAVYDMTAPAALTLAESATPGLVEQFLQEVP